MKKVFLLLSVMMLSLSVSFAQEVSKKKDVSVFGVYSSYNMPSAAVMYFDDQMIGIFNSMKRFNVIGYQYRLDETSAEKFIEKIRALKKEQILSDKKLVDEDLGVVVIPANELKKMLASVFVVLPSISGWRVTKVKVQKKIFTKGYYIYKWILVNKAEVSLSVKIINSEGKLMDVYNRTVDKESKQSAQDAYRKAINAALTGLKLFLRNSDEFKLKTKVLQNLGSQIYLQLGKDMGIKPGYEFVLQKKFSIGGGFTATKTLGLVRVKEIGDNYSTATVINGAPQVNDQLIEAPLMGMRTTVYAGMAPYKSTLSSLKFLGVTKTFSPMPVSIDLGLTGEYELGYAGLARAALGIMLNSPMAMYADLGFGYEFYMGSISIVPEINMSVAANYIDLGSGYYNWDSGDFYLMAWYAGVKPRLTFNIQASQRFKISFYASYSLYFGVGTSVKFKPNSGDSVDITSDVSSSVYYNGSSTAEKLDDLSKYVDLSGLGAGIELVFRY